MVVPRRLAALLPLPLLLLAVEEGIQRAHGPYWACLNFDPDYQYLLNGVNVARGRVVGHVDHPGTPVQILNGVLLRAFHAVSGEGTLEEDVLADPERHLLRLQRAYRGLYAAGLFLLGSLALARTGRLAPAILLQATPLLSGESLYALCRVSPETGLLLAGEALALLVVLARAHPVADFTGRPEPAAAEPPRPEPGDAAGRRARDSNPSEARSRQDPARSQERGIASLRPALLFALVVGLAVATKLTAAPLALVPLLALCGWRPRIAFLGAAASVFALATIPAWHRFPETAEWIAGLVSRRGTYGHGEAGLPGAGELAGNLLVAVRGEPILAAAVLLLAWGALRKRTMPQPERGPAPTGPGPISDPGPSDPRQRLSLALLAAFVLQLLLVAKHPGMRYLVPATSLLGLALWLPLDALRPSVRPRVLGAAVLATLLVLGVALPFRNVVRLMAERRDGALAVRAWLDRDRGGRAVIHHYWGSSPEFALFFANVSAERLYTGALMRKYPDAYFYNLGERTLLSWDRLVTLDEIRAGRPGVLLQGMRFGGWYARFPPPPGIPLEEIFRRGEETVYRVRGP